MRPYLQLAVIPIALAIGAGRASADHHAMMGSGGDDAGGRFGTFGASVALEAADFASMYYVGSYEGVIAEADWRLDRLALGASVPAYRLDENGFGLRGIGDVAAFGRVTAIETPAAHAGVAFALSWPTGNDLNGLGMGHMMLMPAAWGEWRTGRLLLSAQAGYSRALISGGHHDHGPWPLVEPMNMSEITWNAGATIALGSGLRGGARASGGVPVGSLPGHDRIVGAVNLGWGRGRVDTVAELQAGLDGDPFILRGVVQTALHF